MLPAVLPEVALIRGGAIWANVNSRFSSFKGLAHIGVLKELERLRVPIDAIAGISMGAIVGGLYASGKTPEDLQQLVESLDWADAFDDQSKREHRPYRRKQDDAAFPIPLELGLKNGSLQMPRGLIQGQKLALILREQLLPVYDVHNFDDLPTPFRAVASDIATGEAHVMSRGDLELAIRASMSAPGIFSPVVVDGVCEVCTTLLVQPVRIIIKPRARTSRVRFKVIPPVPVPPNRAVPLLPGRRSCLRFLRGQRAGAAGARIRPGP